MCICTYVCMYVCLCVCMYVSVYVCMYVCTYVCMYVCAYVCMYVCMCACYVNPRVYVHEYFRSQVCHLFGEIQHHIYITFQLHFILFLYCNRYAKNLRLYFQEYARLIFENAENKEVKEVEENEYRLVLESPSSDERFITCNSELDLDSMDNKHENNITKSNLINPIEKVKGKEREKERENEKIKLLEKEKIRESLRKEDEDREIEPEEDMIPPHQWQHFESFFKWLDNPTKLPEVKCDFVVDRYFI